MPEPCARGFTLNGDASTPDNPTDSTDWNTSWAWTAGEIVSTTDDVLTRGPALGTGAGILDGDTQKLRPESLLDPSQSPPAPGARGNFLTPADGNMEHLRGEWTLVGMGMQNQEAETWAAACAGDSAAFASIYDLHRDRVFGQALRLIREPHDAEDVTALVFLEAWRRRASVRLVDGSVMPWLLVTTNNVVRNVERGKRRYRAALSRLPKPSLHDEQPDHAESVGERIDQDARDAQVRRAFSSLSKADQDVITLCVIEGLTQAQAAAALGVPDGTVKSRLSRAKKRLADLNSDGFNTMSTVGGGK
ncbi:RNA polymerase sigma factor, sigma-70 family [Herbiconiux ginsengi]|uniref:RNA polymerase sigma factor, sigma-70 family n=2 Tax=Herbiconiux ginsengi TaxID=381665 RepID=A0A1H3QQQ3_9MICO|nr:RNA polymerase sigma factor, sigma-70 family [Herbiconiux ginsengi]